MSIRVRWIALSLIGAVVLALVWPAAAGRIAIVAIVATGVIVALPALHQLARRAPAATTVDQLPVAMRRRTPQKPNHLISLERLVASSGEDAAAPLPFALRDQLRRYTRRRLADHHRLDLDDPRQHGQVALLLSPQLWYVVQPPTRDAVGRPLTRKPIAASWLPYLLDEIESL